jgi:malate dehydrogenase (oxaloacetate-decarboxylating)
VETEKQKDEYVASSQQRPVSPYLDIRDDDEGNRYLAAGVRGIALMRFVLVNKGTAFSPEERKDLGLEGLLPSRVSTMEEQLVRCYQQFQRRHTNLDKYEFLRQLQENQEVLYYRLVQEHLEEMLPIIYTPTVGEAVEQFSEIFQNPRGLTVNRSNVDDIDETLENFPLNDVRMIVATDSSAILGIGDQGYGGLAISIGKLSLYTVGGGMSPFHTMPVALDVGTDRTDLREHPLYLGEAKERLDGDDYLEFIDKFVEGVHSRWPKAIIQWEDLSKDAAFRVLERYRDQVPSFNDDIQGTGAVALAGIVAACERKGEDLKDQRFLIYGAGAGGIGVANLIREGLMQEGLSEQEACDRIYAIDSRGLVVVGRERVDAYKEPFAQTRDFIKDWNFEGDVPDLHETVREGGVTCLVGLSGQAGTFDQELVESMMEHTDRPIIFPLSNPTKLAEGHPEAILRWTNARAYVATGSPFDPVEHDGAVYPIGQGNNAFIFPGLGLGAVLAGARKITDGMVLAAANALGDYTVDTFDEGYRIYPPLSHLRNVSRRVAEKVIEEALKEGVADPDREIPSGEELTTFIENHFWKPEYLPVRYVEALADAT